MALLTVEFPEEISEKLTALAKAESRTKAEILRRAIGLYAHLAKEIAGNPADAVLAIVDKEDHVLTKIRWL